MIPKKIHYCWFGNNELPEIVARCLSNWEEVMPDYEIIRWDETNYNVNKCEFISNAYKNKKWAFVSDYARLDVLYTYGGIYLDTDVKVIKPFDSLLNLKGFCGFESGKKNENEYVNVGLAIGMEKGLNIGKILLDEYRTRNFNDNIHSLEKITCPVLQTKTLTEHGLVRNNKKQVVKGMTIFPTEYFCPLDQYTGKCNITNNTYSIHLYSATWFDSVDRNRRQLRIKYSKYGVLISNIVSTLIAYKKEYGIVRMWIYILKKIV